MSAQWQILSEAAWYVLHALMIGGSIVAVVIGVYLLLAPQRVWGLNRYLNTWFATSKLTDPLDAPRHIERAVYRHHREVGAALLAGALYTLYILKFRYDPQAALNALGRGLNHNLVGWLLDAGAFLLVAGSVLALPIALVLIIRPSLLRDFEIRANRWYHTDRALKPLDVMRYAPDEVMVRHPRITAAVFILGGLYVLTSFGLARF
ncbi:MAG: hypothetical protein Q7U07_06420 [Gammaproteobacteria bacterium]|nr:hypothetical protein [Gammaproteobacteria bacterium]